MELTSIVSSAALIVIALVYRLVTINRVDRDKLEKRIIKLEKQVKELDSKQKGI
jgi:hypothetical protein